MTIFSPLTFGKLSNLLELLDSMRCNILIAGNLQPPYDDEYWEAAERDYHRIKDMLNNRGDYAKTR